MTKSAVRPRNWKAMREDRVLAMAQNRFGRKFTSKNAAIAALAKLPAKEQRSLKKVAVSVAQKAAQSSAARTLAKGMSAAGKAAAKRVAPLALAGIVIAALNRPANAKDANMAEPKKEKTVGDRLMDTGLAGLAGAQSAAMFSSASEVGVGRVAKTLLRFGGILSAAYAVTSAASAISSEAKAAAPISPNDAASPTVASDNGVISTIGDGVKAAADFLTFGAAGLALDAGSETRKLIADAQTKRDAMAPTPPPGFGVPSVRPVAYLNSQAEAKASSTPVSTSPTRAPGSQAVTAPGNSDGMTAGYTRSNGVVVPSYRTPKR
jgi:hypothetical protein